MSYKEKYQQLIALLEELGVLQHVEDWAEQVRQMIEEHENVDM